MALPDPQATQPAGFPSATAERADSRRGLGLLAVTAAAAALVFSIMLAGTRATPEPAPTSATTLGTSPVSEATGTVAVNTLAADDLAARLPGVGPAYAARIVHARTFFGPLGTAADLRALGIPGGTVERVLPRISFRAPDRPGIASPA
ncbi:MAG: helix-hairpin-helix domain-containing protein [Chloroflexi bacterium]|nr:helix-hairpin-helix domain-containing protein [Chloroflexota bacterium]